MRRTPFRPARLVATALGVLAVVTGAAGATLAAPVTTASAANHAPLVGNDISGPGRTAPRGWASPPGAARASRCPPPRSASSSSG